MIPAMPVPMPVTMPVTIPVMPVTVTPMPMLTLTLNLQRRSTHLMMAPLSSASTPNTWPSPPELLPPPWPCSTEPQEVESSIFEI
jgi:hypothetical protein